MVQKEISTETISAEFPFKSHFVEVEGSNIHYIDEGEGDPILFLHGNPTSSYLWRNVIPHLSSLGRCIAPDLIGMGKSDKPDSEYRFFDHYKYIHGFIEKLNLKNITFVIHDWGSAFGFYYSMKNEENVKGIAFMEAILAPVKSWSDFPKDARLMFKLFHTPVIGWFLIGYLNVFIEKVLPMTIVRKLSKEEMDYYREPYLSVKHRLPLWRWPNEIPIEGKPEDVNLAVATYNRWLKKTELPKLLLYAHPGALISEKSVVWCKQHLKNLTTADVGRGIHFIQEDNPHLIGRELAKWYSKL